MGEHKLDVNKLIPGNAPRVDLERCPPGCPKCAEQYLDLKEANERIASLEARLRAAEEALRPFANDGNWFHNYDGAGIIFRNGHGESAQRQAIQAAKEALATASGEGEAGEYGLPATHRFYAPGVWLPKETTPPCNETAGEWGCACARGHSGPHRNMRGEEIAPPTDRPEPPGVVLSEDLALNLLSPSRDTRWRARNKLRVLLDRKGEAD